MDEETWDDPGVAARVAAVAVPVRVDADARPDVYGRYHLGGLPTTALLTAEGDFLRGGTFLSPTQLFGLLDAAAADLRDGRRPAPRPRPASPSGRARRLRRRHRAPWWTRSSRVSSAAPIASTAASAGRPSTPSPTR